MKEINYLYQQNCSLSLHKNAQKQVQSTFFPHWGLNKLLFCGESPQNAIKLFFNTFFLSFRKKQKIKGCRIKGKHFSHASIIWMYAVLLALINSDKAVDQCFVGIQSMILSYLILFNADSNIKLS